VGFEECGVREDALLGARRHDHAVIDHRRVGAELPGHIHVVRGHERCGAKRGEQRHHLTAGARVEVRGGFVEHQHAWFHNQHCGQRGALALAEAQVMSRPAGGIGQADLVKRLMYQPVHFGRSGAPVERPERHVFVERGHEELIVGILEHQAHLLTHFADGRRGDLGAVDTHAARCRPQYAVQVQQERGFAGTVRAEQRERSAFGHCEVDAVEGLGAVGVAMRDTAKLDQGGCGSGFHGCLSVQRHGERRERRHRHEQDVRGSDSAA